MTPLELADELEHKAQFTEPHFVIAKRAVKAAEMLRQLQAENDSLKLQLHTTLTNRELRTYDGELK
jgi:hypothetical protein